MVFIDVPDVGPGLRVGDCTIAWEEHVNYFTQNVLERTLDTFGFTPVAFEKFNYSGGTLAVMARRKRSTDHYVPSSAFHVLATSFSERVADYRERLTSALREAKTIFDNIVIYGVGCRACTLVNGLGLADLIDFAVDDQAERQGKLMPGSHLPVHDSKILARPGTSSLVLLAVNQENEANVTSRTRAACAESAIEFLVVFGPADISAQLDDFVRTAAAAR